MTESEIQNQIRAACNTGNTRAWRNNVGSAQVHGRYVNFGIPGPGGSDLIGLHTLTIQPEHIGCRVAIFTAIECKKPGGRVRPDQINFINFITKSGGIAGIARSADDAISLIHEFKPCP